MEKIPFLNIADINVWMIYLMPFSSDERGDYELVDRFQQDCVKEKVFGMGWDIPCFPYGTKMTEETAAEYTKKYNAQGWSISNDAVKGYLEIKKGDYVIMRLKNSHYYVGKVSSDGSFFMHTPDDPVYGWLSWGATVENWVEYFYDGEVPSEIVGRFSQRLHATIQRVATYRQRLLVMAMYENKLPEQERTISVPKLHIDPNNFVRSLNYMELEDLVALYIADRHSEEGYRLIPSSCKVNQQNYEFQFVSKNRKPITCQVKNQKEIVIDHYVKEKSYEKIYIFSGMWSENRVSELNEKYSEYSHIHIISPAELYGTLLDNNVFYNYFYDFENDALRPEELPLDGYRQVKRIKNATDYTISDDFACFLANDGFFYSSEFGALVLARHIMPENLEKELINQVYTDINRV